MSTRLRSVLFIVSAIFLVCEAHAIPLQVPGSQPDIGRGIVVDDWQNSAELQAVVTLLNQGDRKAAKLRLARFLSQHPTDPRGPEMAGLIFMEEKNLDMAEKSFRRALTFDPHRASARSKLGVTLLMKGLHHGEMELIKALEDNPSDFLARRYLGWMAETHGDLAGAIEQYEAIIASGKLKAGALTEVHARLGKLYNQTQQYQKTISLLAPVMGHAESEQVDKDAQLALATAYFTLDNKTEGAKLLRTLEKIMPENNPELRMLQAASSRLEKNFSDARQKLQSVIKDSPAYAGLASFQLARTYVEEGNWQEGAKQLESLASQVDKNDLHMVLARLVSLKFEHGQSASAIKILEKYAAQDRQIMYMLAEAQVLAHSYADALATSKQLITEFPDYAPAYFLTGVIKVQQKQFTDAEASLQKAVKLNPLHVDAWITMARLHITNKAYDKAETTLKQGLAANPDNLTLLLEMASLHEITDNMAQANDDYRRILVKHPDYAPAMNILALNLADNDNNLVEARKYAERAYALAGKEPIVQDTYAWILLQSGEVTKAVPILETAVKSLPTDGAASYHLGVAYLKAGKKDEGHRYLNKALSLGVNPAVEIKIKTMLK